MTNYSQDLNLQIPLTEDVIRSLHCGQTVRLSGTIYTARDAAHKFLAGNVSQLPPTLNLQNGVIYHCGPVMVKDASGAWGVTAAGPTTSAREEPYMAEVIRKYRLKAVIGKGGMGQKTLAAMQEYGCVYLSAVGGAAQVLANAVSKVKQVYFLEEFGSPEAIWELAVTEFPAIVTMDAFGENLHDTIKMASLTQKG